MLLHCAWTQRSSQDHREEAQTMRPDVQLQHKAKQPYDFFFFAIFLLDDSVCYYGVSKTFLAFSMEEMLILGLVVLLKSFGTPHFYLTFSGNSCDKRSSRSLWTQRPSPPLRAECYNESPLGDQANTGSAWWQPSVFRNQTRLLAKWLFTYLTNIYFLSPDHASPRSAMESFANTHFIFPDSLESQPVIFPRWIPLSSLSLFFEGLARSLLCSSHWVLGP